MGMGRKGGDGGQKAGLGERGELGRKERGRSLSWGGVSESEQDHHYFISS